MIPNLPADLPHNLRKALQGEDLCPNSPRYGLLQIFTPRLTRNLLSAEQTQKAASLVYVPRLEYLFAQKLTPLAFASSYQPLAIDLPHLQS